MKNFLLGALAMSAMIYSQAFAAQSVVSIKKTISAGFAPVQYTGSFSCQLSSSGVIVERSVAKVSVRERLSVTRYDAAYLSTQITKAEESGLTNQGPAPMDAPVTSYSATKEDGTEVLLKGVSFEDGANRVENESIEAQGLIFMLDSLCK